MARKKKKGVGNIHAHHLIGDYIPDKTYEQQVEKYHKIFRNEWFVKYILGFPLFRPIIWLFLGKQVCKFLRLLGAKDIKESRDIHIREMDEAGIGYSVLLLLDYAFAADLKTGETLRAYEIQLKETAESCIKKPFRFFLFHAYDPRRKNAVALLKGAYDHYGIVGIKLYPALGFDPRPEENSEFLCANEDLLDENQAPEERLQMLVDNLKAMYRFAEEKKLPIITHCGSGGSYTLSIAENNMEKVWKFTHPDNYLEIARQYNVRICLAHMGGKKHDEENAPGWVECICKNIKDAHINPGFKGKFYTDQSYDLSRALTAREEEKEKKLDLYINDTKSYLNDEILGRYLLSGSDWPMGIYAFSEREYYKPYLQRLTIEEIDKYFKDNSAAFLFGESKKIPDNYIRFIKEKNGGTVPFVPSWVREENGEYFLV